MPMKKHGQLRKNPRMHMEKHGQPMYKKYRATYQKT